MGLELKPSKTRITYTLNEHEGNVGFDFLSFHVRQYPTGKTHSGKNGRGQLLGFKTIITPSDEAKRRQQERIGDIIRKNRNSTQEDLIVQLNRGIPGWANYFSSRNAKATFALMDHLTYQKLRHWANRRHPRKSAHWIANRYWRIEESGKWDFSTKDGEHRLAKHSRTRIAPHVKVAGRRSTYDGDWAYWATRLGKHPELPSNVAKLLKRQRGKCSWCGLTFRVEDIRENDHIQPRIFGGEDGEGNRQLLHGHCHDVKTRGDFTAQRA